MKKYNDLQYMINSLIVVQWILLILQFSSFFIYGRSNLPLHIMLIILILGTINFSLIKINYRIEKAGLRRMRKSIERFENERN